MYISTSPQVFFLPSVAGKIFLNYHPPSLCTGEVRNLIIVPPFAEEMNCCRQMVTLLVQYLKKFNVGVVVVDLYGTGDSQGEFAEARWETWLGDIAAVHAWLREKRNNKISLLGIRTGALLASEFLQRVPIDVENLIFWQPVISGSKYLNQFFRMQLAEGMLKGSNSQTTTAMLRQKLKLGNTLEIAGYEINFDLVNAMDEAELIRYLSKNTHIPPIFWFDVVSSQGAKASAASIRALNKLSTLEIPVEYRSIVGQPFWSLHESKPVNDLLAATASIWRKVCV